MSRSNLGMVDVTRYVPLHQAHELAVRQAELCVAMGIVEECGASSELTAAITRLGERLKHITSELQRAIDDAMGEVPQPQPITVLLDGREIARAVMDETTRTVRLSVK